ncbi:MAG: 2-amino-4-hydroxy-6-hydroxymethyldihydropteridine diphosphokinase [Ectothiorhodospira sp.]
MTSGASPRRAYVSIGSNVERVRHVRIAADELRAAFGSLTLSPVYESGAVGFEGRPFYNLAAAFETRLPPPDLVARLKAMESRHGRTPGCARFADRTLDLDLLLLGDCVLERPRLPREDILRHAFVLRPLADIAPDLPHPVLGRTIGELWAAFEPGGQWLRPVDFPWATA